MVVIAVMSLPDHESDSPAWRKNGLSVGQAMLNNMPADIPPSLSQKARLQGGVVSRGQPARAGMSPAQVAWLLKRGTWRRVHRSVFVTFTGPLNRTTQLWAAVLCAGRDAYLSHETAAELNRLTDRRAPEIHLTIPAGRRVSPIKGVVIHVSSQRPMVWRPPDIPPYTVAAKTVIDLVQLAVSEDAVIALVTLGFGRQQLGEGHLRAVAGTYRKLRWRRELDEIITQAAGGAHSPLEFRYDRDVQRARGDPALRLGCRHPPAVRNRAAAGGGTPSPGLDRLADAVLARCPAVRDSVAALRANAAASGKATAAGGRATVAGGEAEATAASSKAAAGSKDAAAYPRISSSTAPVSVRSSRTTRAPAAARASAG
jgi:hypothetical protein